MIDDHIKEKKSLHKSLRKMSKEYMFSKILKLNGQSESAFPLENDYDKYEEVQRLSSVLESKAITEEDFWKAILNLDIVDRSKVEERFRDLKPEHTLSVKAALMVIS